MRRWELAVALATGFVIGSATAACTNPMQPGPFTCFTQPRQYVLVTGEHVWEIDRYEQPTPCPATRIE